MKTKLSLSVDFISLVLIRVTVNNSQKKILNIDYLAPDSYDIKFGSVGERTMEIQLSHFYLAFTENLKLVKYCLAYRAY